MNGRWALVVALLLVLSPACSGDTDSPRAQDSPSADEASDLPNLTFEAQISAEELRQEGSEQDVVFAGRWTLTLEGEQYRLETGNGARFSENAHFSTAGLQITADPAPDGTFNCVTKDGERAVDPGSASGLYEFNLVGDELTLEPIDEPCSFRRLALAREWTRTD